MPREAKPRWHEGVRRWYACIGEPGKDGRRREVYVPSELGLGPKDEGKAWEWLNARRKEQQAAEIPIKPDVLTVAALGELYLVHAENQHKEGQLSAMHLRSKGHHIGHWAAALGNRIVRTLTADDMESFIASLRAPGHKLSPNYLANICATISAALNWAVKAKYLEANPVKGFEVPIVPKPPTRFAERGEAATWLRHLWRRTDPKFVAHRYDRFLTLMQRLLIRSGARPGELCCLLWKDLKWNAWKTPDGHVCARATIPFDRWKAGAKTGKSRTIFIPPALTRALRRLHSRPDRHPTYVFVHGRGRGGQGSGQPWADGSTLSKTIRRIRRELIDEQQEIRNRIQASGEASDHERRLAAVVIEDIGENRLTNYRWRHTAASTLLMMGVDVPTVAELLGTSAEMIYRVYGHILSNHLEKAAAKLANKRRD